MRWKHRSASSQRRDDDGVAREAEQFLEGLLLENAFTTGKEIPAWVWLSTLAHGDEPTLIRVTEWFHDHGGVRPEYDEWGRVLQYAAVQVLETSRIVGCALSKLQREVLVPLELAIITTPVGPATIYRILTSTLSEVRTHVGIERSETFDQS
jgi:hypothetical protein